MKKPVYFPPFLKKLELKKTTEFALMSQIISKV